MLAQILYQCNEFFVLDTFKKLRKLCIHKVEAKNDEETSKFNEQASNQTQVTKQQSEVNKWLLHFIIEKKFIILLSGISPGDGDIPYTQIYSDIRTIHKGSLQK